MLISVITVCFNAESHIEQTLLSVFGQTFTDYEYLVIDGGSCDRTVAIVEKYRDRLAYFVSEPDHGIGDAMNKGIAAARGDYLLFLHADDYLLNTDALAHAALQLQTPVAGTPIAIHAFAVRFGETLENSLVYQSRGFTPWMRVKTGVFHQGALCRRTLFHTIGGFDVSLRIAMDYDWFLRAYCAGARLRCYSEALSFMRSTGLSSRADWPSLVSRFHEEKKVQLQHNPGFLWRCFYRLWWLLYPVYRKKTHKRT